MPRGDAHPADLSVVRAAELVRAGQLSAAELVEACLTRAKEREPLYQAFNLLLEEEAVARASKLDGAEPVGPLHGVPLAIKDNLYTAGVPTTANSLIYRDFQPPYDATAVARLRQAGAVILGKTQMGPLATTRATTPEGRVTTVNAWVPHDPSVSPGGSSSGTATAVAGGIVPAGLGTQTGGSITVPALAQGLTGLKPTMGRVSLRGVIPLTYTRDHVGPLARDARDAAVLLQVMAGPDTGDPRTMGLPPVPDFEVAALPPDGSLRWPTRIGVLPGYLEEAGTARGPREDLLRRLEELGAALVEVELPEGWELITGPIFNNVRLPERSEPFLEHLRRDVRLFGVSLPSWINGLLLSGDEYLKGQRVRLLVLRLILERLMADCDVLLQTSHLAFDQTGLPLIAFPIGVEVRAGRRTPVGALLGGLPFGEERLLSVVAAYQAGTEWHLERPPDPAAEGPGALGPGDRGRIRAAEVMELTQ